MQNKKIKNYIITALIFVLGFLGYQAAPNFGGGRDADFNKIDNLTTISTTTASVLPVKLLNLDANRRYAVVSNASDTAIYLYATTTDLTAGLDASNAIKSRDGVYVGANSNFIFDTDNMVYSNIWASSTAADKQINVSYK